MGYNVRVQMPLAISDRNMPEPDIAVVAGSIRDYARDHPVTAILLMEVSDTTLTFDRVTKAGIYARAGIEDYWILNLVDHVLEVYRQPACMSRRLLGHYYRSVVQYAATDSLSSLAAPTHRIAVADLLP